MNHSSPLNFLGEEAEVGAPPRVRIIPAPLARSLSWGKGADLGPRAILEASPALEVFDDELLVETVGVGIETNPELRCDLPLEESLATICDTVGQTVDQGMLPVLLGGEHTVTVAAVAALAGRFPDLSVVQIDAHLDLRDRYDDDPFSHACVMRRIDDLKIPFTQVGIRSFSREEWEFVLRRGMRPFTMERIHAELGWMEAVCSSAGKQVYLTIDVDGLDPSIMPATGTPEPDGLAWREVTALLRALALSARIVGFDIVEFAPRPGQEHAAFCAAKLLYRLLGYVFRAQLAGPTP